MENFYNNKIPMYPNRADMNSKMAGSPYTAWSGGYYNLHRMMTPPPLDPYAFDNRENIDPQLLMSWSCSSSSSGDNFSTPSAVNRPRYWGGYGNRSPLSLMESFGKSTSSSATRSPPVFANGALAMEEGVLVMDGVLVGNGHGGRQRSGKDSSGSSSSSVKSYTMDVCRSWAETGSCQYGSNCQFSHRKEDANRARFSNKGKPELEVTFPRSPFSDSSLSIFRGQNSYSSPTMSSRGVVYGRSPLGTGSADGSRSSDSQTSRTELSPVIHSDWVPQDEGIDVRPPGVENPTREEVLAYMNSIMYGPRVRKRLPVFTSICPDSPPGSPSPTPPAPTHLPPICPASNPRDSSFS
uniref:C3H1-type domain-containing protein n=1 Tax=Kalanchoe fedtschenkoi TaxID=63787 RepID=A0A7N0VL87_KALFE